MLFGSTPVEDEIPAGSETDEDIVAAMKFRKKPVVIEAIQPSRDSMPDWLLEALNSGNVETDGSGIWFIKTLEGTDRADPGDWIIRGIKGELYPCKPDIFSASYEPAE